MDDLGLDEYKGVYQPGDLVEYMVYHYTPDLYYQDEELDRTLGVVIEAVKHPEYIVEPWMYRVFWFTTGRVTEVPSGHLRIISAPST